MLFFEILCGMVVVGRFGSVWPDLSKNAIFQNPSKKMRLDESFHLLPVACHNSIVVKSYGQITKITLRQGKYPPVSYLNISTPLSRSVS